MFSVFNAILAGQASDGITDMLTTLRAVILYKDADRTRVRPRHSSCNGNCVFGTPERLKA